MRRNGFTLIEMIVTIVVVAIIFLGIAGFVEFGTKGYTQTVDRQRLQNQARFAIEKLQREISHAVPNSFDLVSNNQCLSFYPIEYAGFYARREDTGRIEFVVGNELEYPHTFPTGTRLVINPSRMADLQNNGQSVSIAEIKSSESDEFFSVTMNPPSDSAANRHFIYRTNKVEYCITSDDELRRNDIVVTKGIDSTQSEFRFQDTSLQRGGLIHLDFLFFSGDERSYYKHDVQVKNVP
ncbi:PilW family protein [Vibrio comitans]|uniref:MSHA biogenesis protein MshO n=1 Tax=Vibrio comitans NBRC 102076 TaxID=1219078 RepID=A0A4Y3IU78_9VIBR|nr:prepilin-type N-terminal cleavage/methylation domain-containing protein [Vibrio comitans]GEA62338.1 MSHA biogenesis protein MshO [Vibrio comitans NBRC 102076]